MIFSNLALKPVATVFSGLASKPVAIVSPGLALKSVVGFLVEPQNRQLQFGDLGLKITAMVYWFVPQNHRDGLLVCASKSSMLRFLGCATKPMGGRRCRTCVEI
jgi:hypothetical protein